MTTIDLNEIISVFLQRHVNELTLTDVTNALEANGKSLSIAEIRHVVCSFGLSLFQIRGNRDDIICIRVDPTIAICSDFLDGKCFPQRGACKQLHVCRYFDRCKKKDCRFPHNFTTGNNRRIVQQANCENIDPIRLICLLRLNQFPHGSFKKSAALQVVQKPTNKPSPPIQPKYNERVFERSDSSFSTRASQNSVCSSATNRDDVIPSPSCISKVDTSRLLDVCFAPTSTGRFVNIEKIELFLNQQNLPIRKMFNLKENKCFQRWTLEFATDNAVAYLLARPVIPYESFHLKFKRSKPMIDQKSFILKSIINSKRGPITIEKFSVYIDTLIKNCLHKLTDLSSQFEQILLVQCDQALDFDLLFRVQKSRRQLQGRDVSLKQVYELDSAVIECIHTPLSNEIVRNIIKPVIQDVFEFNVVSSQCAFVEFLNSDTLQQWLLSSEINKQQFGVSIKYNIQCVEKDDFVGADRNASRASNIAQSTEVKAESMSCQTRIRMLRGEAMITNHPTFSIEYKNYIQSELGYEIDIRGNQIQIHLETTSDCLPKEDSLRLLTSKFMEKFAFRSVSFQEPIEQLNILRAHSTTVAFCCVKDNKYLLATKKSNVHTFMQKLFPNKSRNRRRTNPRPSATSTVQRAIESEDEPPLVPFWDTPAPLNSSSTYDRYLPTLEIITKNIELSLETLAQTIFFADKTFKDRLRKYFDDTHGVKINFVSTTESGARCMIKLIGEQDSVDNAAEELLNLCSLMHTISFDKTADLSWTKIKEAACVIQHQLSTYNIIYVCQQLTSPKTIVVHHVEKKHREFGIDEQIIETVCRKKLVQATCIHMLPTRFETEWIMLKTTILQRADYRKDICLFYERPILSLFGLPQIVKDLEQQFNAIKMKDKKIENSFPDTKIQPNYFPSVIEAKLKQSEKLSTAVGDKLNVKHSVPNSTTSTAVCDRPNLTISATVCDHPKVVSNSMKENDQKRSITFDVYEPGFEVLVNTEYSQLLAVVDSKCSLEKQIINHRVQIQIPKAKVTHINDNTSEIYSQENVSESIDNSSEASANSTSNWFLDLFRSKKPSTQQSNSAQQPTPSPRIPSASSSNDTKSVTIGKSKIIVCTGDLTKQAVDIIVVCSSSRFLCDKITSAAGPLVESVYNQQSSFGLSSFETECGNLPCRKIAFRPWISDKNDLQMLRQSVETFVTSVTTYAVRHNWTTIAFPSIGCGLLGHDPKLIAEYMVGGTYQHLKNSLSSQLIVSFVLLPEQQNVFRAFTDQLNTVQSIDDTPISIFFDKQTVKIKLTSTNDSALIECQNKINILARSCSAKFDLSDSTDIADWPQASIQKYYEYCLKRRVIPTLDIQNCIVNLFGPKNAVSEAEKYLYQLTAETLRNARIQVMSRGFVWSVEVLPGKWEQYPYRINQQIEDAEINKRVEFTNENKERCRVDLKTMEEQYQKRKRKIERKQIDSSLPANWDLSGGSFFKRVTLSNSSTEYKGVINQFDTTMKGHYSKIIKIERIQNKRWYKQYAAHRDDFQQRYTKPDERLLFHGSDSTAADKIVQEFFNRAYAGAHAVVYGRGVYFHEHATYSHGYTRPDALGQRRMFLARVLIGRTCVGNSSMKVPPEGFDTTTDGGHIFVVYHDAGAYGEYLLTYI